MDDGRTTRRLAWEIAKADFKERYSGSLLGYLWVVLEPALLFAVIYAVVTNVLFRFDDQVEHYGVILLFNIIVFMFFSQGTQRVMRSLGAGGALLRRMPLQRYVPPSSALLTTGFGFVANLVVYFVFFIALGPGFQLGWLLLPVVLAAAVLVTGGIGLLLAAAFVRYRDISHLWPATTRVLFYTTVIFPIEFLPRVLQDVQSLNPLAPIVTQARVWLVDSSAPGWFELDRPLWAEIAPFAVAVVLIGVGLISYRRVSHFAAEEV